MLGIYNAAFMTATRQSRSEHRRWDAPAHWTKDDLPTFSAPPFRSARHD